MADPAEDVEVDVTTTAAQEFVDTYYEAINNQRLRTNLPSFYITPTPTSPLKPDISMNGNIIADPAELQTIFEKQIDKTHYEVQSFDCHVLNTNYNVGANEAALGPDKTGKKMSIMVMISGSTKYWKDGGDGEVRGFTESIVLVPNWEAQGPKAAKGAKRWLIQSQNFRLVT